MEKVDYDLIIAGGGPAGLTSGLYAARARLQTLLVEKMSPGGQAATTFHIENYPGFAQGYPARTWRRPWRTRRNGLAWK